MIGHIVSAFDHRPRQIRVAFHSFGPQEEGGLHTMLLQNIKDAGYRFVASEIIKGQGNFFLLVLTL